MLLKSGSRAEIDNGELSRSLEPARLLGSRKRKITGSALCKTVVRARLKGEIVG